MTEKNNDATALLQVLVAAMEQALAAGKRDERVECEVIWKQMRQPGGFRRRLNTWRKYRDAQGDDDGTGDMGAGANMRPRRRKR